jgi:hypothetical protein
MEAGRIMTFVFFPDKDTLKLKVSPNKS